MKVQFIWGLETLGEVWPENGWESTGYVSQTVQRSALAILTSEDSLPLQVFGNKHPLPTSGRKHLCFLKDEKVFPFNTSAFFGRQIGHRKIGHQRSRRPSADSGLKVTFSNLAFWSGIRNPYSTSHLSCTQLQSQWGQR